MSRPKCCRPVLDPGAVLTAPAAAGEICDGVATGIAVWVATGVAVAAAVAAAAAAGVLVMVVTILAVQLTADAPGFPVPLHWLTVIGIARLTWELGSTEQRTAAPPPLPEALHWVTVAAVVAGEGWQLNTPPPPLPEATHWLTVEAVRGCAPGVFARMMFVMLTLQLIACAASLSELLHCRTTVTRPVDWVVNVPFGVEQGSSVHSRVTVVVELVDVPLVVLTTATVHRKAVVAPLVPGPWLLHWSTTMVAAWAAVGKTSPAMPNAPVSIIRTVTMVRHVGRDAGLCAGAVSVLM